MKRTLLLPDSGLVDSIPNTPTKKFNNYERKSILTAALHEVAWRDYYCLAGPFSFSNPVFEGHTEALILERAGGLLSKDEISYIAKHVKERIRNVIMFYGLFIGDREHTLLVDEQRIGFWEGQRTDVVVLPNIFDHGYQVSWYHDILQITWTMPVVNNTLLTFNEFLGLLLKWYPELKPSFSSEKLSELLNFEVL